MGRAWARDDSLTPRVSIVIPAYAEGDAITAQLEHLFAAVRTPCEVFVVVDSPTDTTVASVERYARRDPRLRLLVNTAGPGPANAIRYGMNHAGAPTVVVSMADGSDDVERIDEMVRLVEQGAAIVSASRYMPGGHQEGGPVLKRTMSRIAGFILWTIARIGTRDPTNAFKAYSADFLGRVRVESSQGFEMALELCAKARRLRLPVREIPATWRDRTEGASRFRLLGWLPSYLRWFFHAFGRSQVRA